MASLQPLGGDRWRVRVWDADRNKLVSRSFTAKGIRAAERQRAEIETALRAELDASAAARAEIKGTIGELVDDWLAVKSRDKSPSTMIAYRRHAKRITDRFGKMQAVDLTGRDIDRWYSELMAGGMSAANVQHVHRVIRAVLRFGHIKRDLPVVATDKASPPSHLVPEVVPPPSTSIVRLLETFPAAPEKQWPRAVRLLIFTGLRRGEVVGLRWDDWTPGTDTTPGRLKVRHSIVEVKGGIHIGPPKGKRVREIALNAQADLVLDQQQRYLAREGLVSPWVFPDRLSDPTGKTPRRPGWVSLMFNRWRDKNAPGLHLHALRHHFATMLLDAGTPVNTVQRTLGHADASTTLRIYGHRTDEGEQKMLEAAKSVFG